MTESNTWTVKLLAGRYLRTVTITRERDRLFLRFGFNRCLMEEVKAMAGARWHGYDEKNPRKVWSVSDCGRNRFQLAYLAHPGPKDPLNPYSKYDRPLVEFESRRPLYKHQLVMARAGLTYRQCVFAAEMGCVAGTALVQINYEGATSSIMLQQLYSNWLAGWRHHRVSVRSLCGEFLEFNEVRDVLYRGLRRTLRLVTEQGRSIALTPDHEVCVSPTGDAFKAVEQLSAGDPIYTNGVWRDGDGYVRVGGLKHKHPRWEPGGVYEHVLVMEAALGRYLGADEVVHHRNGIRDDNGLDNLELLSGRGERARSGVYQSGLLPRRDRVLSIEEAGVQNVYDVVCEDPYRNFVAGGVIVHNCGKTLAAIEVMERSGVDDWLWVGPRSALYSVQLEFERWRAAVRPKFYTYEAMKKLVETWPEGRPAPGGLVVDECSRCKNPTAQRTQAVAHMAEAIRREHGDDGYVIEMSGSPAPKSPADWWSVAEIACPGFIREGTLDKFKKRLAVIAMQESLAGGAFPKLVTWRDNPAKCDVCGQLRDDAAHDAAFLATVEPGDTSYHAFKPSVDEVSYLYKRMRGLVHVFFKRTCLDLPEKIYKVIECKPTQSALNAARAIVAKSPSAIVALTLLRELSDGFQYSEEEVGFETCDRCHGARVVAERYDISDPDSYPSPEEFECGHRVTEDGDRGPDIKVGIRDVACSHCSGVGIVPRRTRTSTQVACPKEDALRDLLEEHEDVGRIVIFAGFTGSIDRCVQVASRAGWAFVRADGRGWYSTMTGKPVDLLRNFQERQDLYPRVAFIGQPGAAGMGLNLTASPTIVYYSNDFNAESRLQSEDRCHRPGMDVNRGCTIVDLIHLPTDLQVLNNLREKRRLQDMTMGAFKDVLDQATSEARVT